MLLAKASAVKKEEFRVVQVRDLHDYYSGPGFRSWPVD
jgi:hypothetical protein